MAIFMADVAFGEGERLVHAKLGIFSASVAAGVAGYSLARRFTRTGGEDVG